MMKVMFFLTGNAEGFRVSEKTIMERCNISESGYKNARKKLVEMGWLNHKSGDYIQVNYDKIFNDYKALRAGSSDKPSVPVENEQVRSVTSPSQVVSEENQRVTEKTFIWSPDYTHNKINNRIKQYDMDKIIFSCENSATAAADAAAIP